jgi:uncharacterized membrane protein YphA (DoxX/SURF4 family)
LSPTYKKADQEASGQKGIVVNGNFLCLPAIMGVLAVPSTVIWSYSVGGVIFAIGLAVIFLRGDWQKSQGLDKLILFGPLFYAAPLASFGTEHFTLTPEIASIIPAWIPWHTFWAYFVGSCFIAATLSVATRIQTRLAASLLALNFFLFVVLMDVPALLQDPHDRIAAALALRELAFSGGALALAASLTERSNERLARIQATVARYFVAIPVVFYSFEQFLHADHVPAVPLERMTPTWIPGHAIWTYVAAAGYAIAGIPLLLGKKTRTAATWVGLTVLFIELVVYLPIAVMDFASLDNGLNYAGDTLMFCGAVFLLAGAMPRETRQRETSAEQLSQENRLPNSVN